MVNAWINETKPREALWTQFLALFDEAMAYRDKNPWRLRLKVGAVWGKLSWAEKRDFSLRLALSGRLGQQAAEAIVLFEGLIIDPTGFLH